MANTKIIPEYNDDGKVTYDAGIVKGIVVLAVSKVQGVSLKNGGKKDKLDYIKISFNGDVITVDVTVDFMYGYNVPDIAFDIQESIKQNVEAVSKYKVSSVDVHFDNVFFSENSVE